MIFFLNQSSSLIFFLNIHFFHAQLGLDVFPNLRLLHTSLNATHSQCKHPYHPSHTLSKFSYPYLHISPLSSPHFYRLTPNHLHSYVPPAQTTSIYHASTPQPCSEPQKTVQIHTAPPILQRHHTMRTSISPSSVLSFPDFADLLSSSIKFNLSLQKPVIKTNYYLFYRISSKTDVIYIF